jgi:hypothetical protein
VANHEEMDAPHIFNYLWDRAAEERKSVKDASKAAKAAKAAKKMHKYSKVSALVYTL